MLDCYIALCVCTACGMYMWVWVMCAYMHTWSRVGCWISCPNTLCLTLWRQGVSLNWKLAISSSALAREISGSICLCAPNLESQDHEAMTSFLYEYSGPHVCREILLTTGPSPYFLVTYFESVTKGRGWIVMKTLENEAHKATLKSFNWSKSLSTSLRISIS